MFPGCQVPRPTWEVVRFPNPLATGSKLGGEPDYLGSRGTWFVGNNENIIPKDALGSPSLGEPSKGIFGETWELKKQFFPFYGPKLAYLNCLINTNINTKKIRKNNNNRKLGQSPV